MEGPFQTGLDPILVPNYSSQLWQTEKSVLILKPSSDHLGVSNIFSAKNVFGIS
jgi:hypothetical protein